VPVLNLSLSGSIDSARIAAVIQEPFSEWKITLPRPNNDYVKHRRQLQEFRELLRGLMDEIKLIHGQKQILHVFPAAPVSVNLEVGRVRMPKADMVMRIYDENNEHGGFIHALDLGGPT